MSARRISALLVVLSLMAAATVAGEPSFKAGVFSPPRQAPDFTLSGSDGSELKLASYRGKVVVLAFGFTSCVDVCPITLAVLAQARRQLGADGNDLQVVYVTVDPERDDAARMRNYLAAFDRTFVGGTGTSGQLAAVRKEYGIIADRKIAESGYTVAHSSFAYLIDRTGYLRALMPYGSTPDDYVHDLRILLTK